jgi:protein-S-isoprenylcysteine O-methyltransferase Ste14
MDLGRLVMVPSAAVLLVLDAIALTRRTGGPDSVLRLAGAVEVCVFYALVIWCYLRRRPAVATSHSVTGHIAAVAATLLPFTMPLLAGSAPGATQQAAADVLLVAGTAWSLWSLRSLGRNLSVLAQAREVAERGPYRWVRHPLYLGEILSALGLALAADSVLAALFWLAMCGLQGYRAVREEQVLLAALPGYREYRRRTAALLPGVF